MEDSNQAKNSSSRRDWPYIVGLHFTVIACVLYVVACYSPAVHFDNIVSQRTSCTGSSVGIGNVGGLQCLLFGWIRPPFCFPWLANFCIPAAFISTLKRWHRLATAIAVCGVLLGLLTPVLLWTDIHFPVAFPESGYFYWQLSLFVTLAAVVISNSQFKVSHLLLCLGLPAILLPIRSVFQERSRGIWVQVSGRIRWPEGTKPSERGFKLELPDLILNRESPKACAQIENRLGGFSVQENGQVDYKTQYFTEFRPNYAKLYLTTSYKPTLEIPHIEVIPPQTGDNVYQVKLGDVVVPALPPSLKE